MSYSSFSIITKDGRVEDFHTGSSVIALGTFDGVHIAHRALLEKAIEFKKKIGAETVGAWCFSESPTNWLRSNIPALCTLEEKVEMMLSLGLDFVAVGDFRDFRDVLAEDFANNVIKARFNCTGVVCGFNHHFGYKGLGNPELLKEIFGEENTLTVDEIKIGDETVSSTAIKKHIASGEFEIANAMLGRCYTLYAKIITGKHLGHTLGFPTANQRFPKDIIIPGRGIYATRCILEDGRVRVGVSNIGFRPTITDGTDTHITNCETYIHDFSENIYDQMLKVEFCTRLRNEKKFESIKDLRDQISSDCEAAVKYFKEVGL